MTDAHELLPWQSADWARLAPALTGGRLAHGLLLTGARGIGKRHLAGVLAHALLCEAPGAEARPCGGCRSCVQMAAGAHPDRVALKPAKAGEPIKIAAVRDFVHALYLTSRYGRGRVALIDPADQMTPSAANSLLKALEEPPAGSHILLIADRPRAVLPTIRSRCQHLRLIGADSTEAASWLEQAPAGTSALLPLARGAPLRAAQLAEAGAAEAQVEWFQSLGALAAGQRDPVALAEQWSSDDTGALLDWLYLVCLDVVKAGAGADRGALLFGDHAETIATIAAAMDADEFRKLLPELVRTRRLRDTQADARLSLETLCIQLFECRYRARRGG